jgi:hypothetical protein
VIFNLLHAPNMKHWCIQCCCFIKVVCNFNSATLHLSFKVERFCKKKGEMQNCYNFTNSNFLKSKRNKMFVSCNLKQSIANCDYVDSMLFGIKI